MNTSSTNTIVWDRWTSGSSSTTTSGKIWTAWSDTYIIGGSTSASITATTDPWIQWVRSTNTSSTSTIGTPGVQIWTHWSDRYRISDEEFQSRQRRTAEQQAQYVEQQARRDQERVAAEGEKQKARERAAQLLQAHLSEEQRLELAANGSFMVRSIDKNGQERHYEIRKGYQRNIHEIDPSTKKRLNTICAHPGMRVPDEDAMLIQKLMLESPEGHDEFLKIANVSRLYN